MSDSWLMDDRAALASDRILDAAGRCFAAQGLTGTSIGDIAREAGCSRPTVYRYFADRHALRVAFVHREARSVGARVRRATLATTDQGERIVVAIRAALKEVRADATLSVWFSGDGIGTALEIAGASSIIQAMTESMLGDLAGAEREAQARWLVRVILSLLAMPGSDEIDEQEMIERFVVPVLVTPMG
jgi:AcrR family transcriptional regulator